MSDFPIPIVFVSNAGLDYGLPTNRQQLPRRLAEHTTVLYAAPFSLSQAAAGRVSLSGYRSGLRRVSGNLYQYQYVQLLPMVRGESSPLKRLDERITKASLRRQLAKLRMREFVLWLYFPPSFRYLIGQLGESVSIYHCTDDHAGYAEVLGYDSQRIAIMEQELVDAVDVVFTTSRPLFESKRMVNPDTYLMPNVADIKQYEPVALGEVVASKRLDDVSRPIAGFVGAVSAYKVDLELVRDVALILKDWSFVFVGPVGLGDGTSDVELPQLPNIHFVGSRAHNQLPQYLAAFDVCLIPYRINSYTRGVFPLKLWEYLAAGKPVVTTPLPALTEYGGQISLAATAEAFASAIRKEYIGNGADAAKNRLQTAKGHSWEQRAVEILDVLRQHL